MIAHIRRTKSSSCFVTGSVFCGKSPDHAGLSPADGNAGASLRLQLDHFAQSLELQGAKGIKRPKSWLEAFFLLEKHLQDIDDGSRQVVFLDELPWLDTPRSGFLTAFEAFWNGWGCSRKNLMVIVCGSATSWVLDRLVNNHGGLYNRLTYEIRLVPFTLSQCEKLLESRHVHMSRYDIAQAYMTCGGIPYYLNYLKHDQSLDQNVNRLCFAENAILKNEYHDLYRSLFNSPEKYIAVVNALAGKSSGMNRNELCKTAKLQPSGATTKILEDLELCGFIRSFNGLGKGRKNRMYQFVDFFSLFYLKFIVPFQYNGRVLSVCLIPIE